MLDQRSVRAFVGTSRLTVRVVNVDVHGSVQGADEHSLIGTKCLVSSVD